MHSTRCQFFGQKSHVDGIQCQIIYKLQHIMSLRKALAIAALTLTAGTSHAWTLVYSNDAAGNATSGSLQTLRSAVSNGSSIKVVLNSGGTLEWAILCSPVAILNGTAQDVLCFGTQEVDTVNDASAQFGTPILPARSIHFRLNSRGTYIQTNVRLDNGGIMGSYPMKFSMRWYAE